MHVAVHVDGNRRMAELEPTDSLLVLLRDRLGIQSVKKACGEGRCGSCTVLLDGMPMCSCIIFAWQAEGRQVTTIGGLTGRPIVRYLQRALLEEGAVQCGFCIPGMLVSVIPVLSSPLRPSRPDLQAAIDGNLCRCTGYRMLISAFYRAYDLMHNATTESDEAE